MHRIDGAGHVLNHFVTEDALTNRPPTEVTADILNAFQEELASFVEWAGLTLDKADNTQLRQALSSRFAAIAGLASQVFNCAAATSANHAVNLGQFLGSGGSIGWRNLPGGEIEQWGWMVSTGAAMSAIFPIAFPTELDSLIVSVHGIPGYQLHAVVNTTSLSGFDWSGFISLPGFPMNPSFASALVIDWRARGK